MADGIYGTIQDKLDDYIPPTLASGLMGAVAGGVSGGPVGALAGWVGGIYYGHTQEVQAREQNRKDHPNTTGRPYGMMSDAQLATYRTMIERDQGGSGPGWSNFGGGGTGYAGGDFGFLSQMRRDLKVQILAGIDEEIAGRRAGLFQAGLPAPPPNSATMADRSKFVKIEVPGPAASFPPVPVHSLQQLVWYAFDTVAEGGKMLALMGKDPGSFNSLLPEFLARQAERDKWRSGLRGAYVANESKMLPAEDMAKVIGVQTGQNIPGRTPRPGLPEYMKILDAIGAYQKFRKLGGDIISNLPRKVPEVAGGAGGTGGGAVAGVVTLGTVVALASFLK